MVGQMSDHSIDLDHTFRALADPTRRALLPRLAQGPASVKELAVPFAMALPSFMEHLKRLEASGLLVSEKRGQVRVCRLDRGPFRAAESWLAEQRRFREARLDRLDDHLLTLREKDHE
jgi:DNA-binding transcriptional ArsR family regulator